MLKKIKRALISCTDKSGLVDFCRVLDEHKVHILSTGGTAKLLRDAGITVTEVAEFTGQPEILDGRVKTLHPKIHGGLLGRRDVADHVSQMQKHGIENIDLVIVNLYAFEKTVAREGCSLEDAVENIDIGGPSMLRSAAKNHEDVTVVVDPLDYPRVADAITKNGGTDLKLRFELAVKAFEQTARYDTAISKWLRNRITQDSAVDTLNDSGSALLPDRLELAYDRVQTLRYGENPHQVAAFYADPRLAGTGIAGAKQLQGKELSFNNILDLEAANTLANELIPPACVIVKHTNPCGTAVAERPAEAFLKARAADPVSSFGGIIGLNRVMDGATARLVAETFFEAIAAPGYTEEALAILSSKKNLRLMQVASVPTKQQLDVRSVSGGLLVQSLDHIQTELQKGRVVTKRSPSPQEWLDLAFAWTVVKNVKSNAIVFARDGQTLGVGAGQMSRVDAVKIAVMKAVENFKDEKILKSAVIASDAFFPFRDGLDAAARAGAICVVQPGGSVRDDEVIAAADEYNMAMIFTGERHFKH